MSLDCVRRALRRACNTGAKMMHELSRRVFPRTGYDRFRDIMYILETDRVNFLPVDPQRVTVENSLVRVALRRICDGDQAQMQQAATELGLNQPPISSNRTDFKTKDVSRGLYDVSMHVARVIAAYVSRMPCAIVAILVDTQREADNLLDAVRLFLADINDQTRHLVTVCSESLVFSHPQGGAIVYAFRHESDDRMGPLLKNCILIEIHHNSVHMHDVE